MVILSLFRTNKISFQLIKDLVRHHIYDLENKCSLDDYKEDIAYNFMN